MKKNSIVSLLLFLSIVPVTFAQSPTPSPILENTYTLPYPGMLPDHPLYKIKVLRDKLIIRLTSDPAKQVGQYLLQTDKGIAMVPLLIEKKNIAKAQETALKAEHNFTELTFVYKKTRTKPDTETYKRLQQAGLKHQDVLSEVIKTVKEEDQKVFQQVINFSKTNLQELEKILKEKK